MKTSTVAALAAAAAGLWALAWPTPAPAQCVAGNLYDALSKEWKLQFNDGPNSIAVFDGGKKLIFTGNSSYGLMDLGSAAVPFEVKKEDLVDTMGCSDDCGLMASGGSSDGLYFMVGSIGWGLGAMVFKQVAGTYIPVGRYDLDAPNVGIHTAGGRHVGISTSALNALVGPLFADLDTASGSLSTEMASEPFQPYFPPQPPISTGPYIVLSDVADIYVIKVDPALMGVAPNFMTAMQSWKITALDLGAVTDDVMAAFTAAVDPNDTSGSPRVYIFTRFQSSSDPAILTYRLAEFIPGSPVKSLGSFIPPGTFAKAFNSVMHPIGAVPVANDVAFFGWAGDDPGQELSILRLYSFLASNWPTPVHSDYYRKDLPYVYASAYLSAGSTVYGYFGQETLSVVSMACSPGQLGDAGVHAVPPDAGDPSADGGGVSADGGSTRPDGSVVARPDAGCLSGVTCTSADGCKQGKMSCSGTPTCTGLLDLADGTACGAGGQCKSGVCVECQEGASCDGPDGCTAGVWSCSGTPSCTSLQPKPDGASCGTARVCYQQQCVSCTAGGKCTSVDGCKHGTTTCKTGQLTCDDSTFVNEMDGTLCSSGGSTGKCQGGVCSSCTDGTSCLSENGCQQGTVSCTGGAVCGGYKNVANGTACKGGVCNAGACVACVAGLPCESADTCATGTTSCNYGTVKCGNLMFKTNGTACPGGVCSNGICKIPPDAGTPVIRDAAVATGEDAAAAPGEDAGETVQTDTGGSKPAPTGCGCQSGVGSAWSALLLATGAMFLRRRR